ncbi:SusD/RagB family nutrient-binding outer membrane lipoprotein [Pedobacter sp. G11]|uniref:SusD/RagB family nutrient-binding outer membrane lipoprotein n=1 Tax=Pedobacter sp. G11 TaxID=2482728 RepID=UPI000F5D627E|nr:SusD/RagB family nutrient-binding outer membrane lipoprotein [Pedobacter sp. G11]AZI24813.1 SusD/RagB family nutrient-binding outer membrane lipoprotein [Pedobacter sp. G11]
MKKIFNGLLIVALAVGFTSCKKYLDINENPNSSTESTPALVLPQAIVNSAAVSQSYNSAYYFPGGFAANIYGVGSYGASVTYAYTAGSFTNLFSGVYNNATDYQYVIDNTAGNSSLVYSNAIARIMKSFMFSKLVDQYNDVPYSEALKGSAILTPKYDKAEDIYKDLVAQLTASIKAITDGQAVTSANKPAVVASSTDPLFKGDMNLWKKFANTVKLRLLIKMAGVPAQSAYATTEFAALSTSVGFLETDALVNPGYLKEANRQNPLYNSLAFGSDGVRSQAQAVPTIWILTFYNGTKISDQGRGYAIYRGFPSPAVNRLGEENLPSTVVPPAGSTSWFTGTDANTPYIGVAKGPAQGQPILLAAESRFLQAEAFARGYLTGSAKTAFDEGIKASFKYIYQDQAGAAIAGWDYLSESAAYQAQENPNNPLVNYPATGLQAQIEAIITQKYIAMNVIHCDEAFNEFKRTGFPKIVDGSSDGRLTFASKQSQSTRPDKLISRILYPSQEYSYNPGNVPAGVTLFGSRIFWDLN